MHLAHIHPILTHTPPIHHNYHLHTSHNQHLLSHQHLLSPTIPLVLYHLLHPTPPLMLYHLLHPTPPLVLYHLLHPTSSLLVPPPPPHLTASLVPPPPPHPTTSLVPPPIPHPTTNVVPPPPPHPTTNVVPLPSLHYTAAGIVSPTPDPMSYQPPATPTTCTAPSAIPVTTLPRMKLPQTLEGWAEADRYMQANIVPGVLMQENVDVMNQMLCQGIHSFFTSKYGTIKANQKHQHLLKAQNRKNALKEVQMEKNEVKKRLRRLRREGNSAEEVKTLAYEFHHLIRKHSKLSRKEKKAERQMNQNQQRKECHRNPHAFAKKILNDDGHTSIQPSFSKHEAESFFTSTYSATAKTFNRPSWMPEPPSPTIAMDTSEFTEEEVRHIITKSKATSTPSPVDQIPYLVLKKCPSLTPALLHIFNTSWALQRVPAAWKVGVIQLIGKKNAEVDPSKPNNFRPIALTSCIGKVFTSLVKQRWMSYMVGNNYLNTAVQKAFVEGVPGCTEHHLKLLSILREARKKHKSLCICWLDLANAFGSVHHDLIRFSLQHYHAPQVMVDMISSLYQDLKGVITTKSWQTDPIHLQMGVYQGDPLSVIVFNTVMNTFVDTITRRHPDLGYTLGTSSHRSNLLQYADDTSLITDGPSSCRTLITTTETWLMWSGMKANVPKCVSLAVRASSGKPYDPNLSLNGETIPYIGDSTFHFLGAPVCIHGTTAQARDGLIKKLTHLLKKVDATLVSRQQKLKLFKLAVCPRLTWELSVNCFPLSWLKTTLQPIATSFLKRWCGLAKSADTGCLFLPKEHGGLDLPSLTLIYQKLQVTKAATYTCSRDPMVRAIASQETRKEATQQRPTFKPFQEVIQAMKDNPGASSKQLSTRAKKQVEAADTEARLSHSMDLVVQNQPLKDNTSRAPRLWSSTIVTLPERVFKFALNSLTDTLPHNANLHMWKKLPSPSCNLCGQHQTLIHILNACPYALEKRRYNARHDAILQSIYNFLVKHLPPTMSITVDLCDQQYAFSQQIAITDSRPDIAVWDKTNITLIELTVPFETCTDSAIRRKRHRYQDLLSDCKANGYSANLLTVEVGSRGFLHCNSFNSLYDLVPDGRRQDQEALETEIIQICTQESYPIWCKRNWKETETPNDTTY